MARKRKPARHGLLIDLRGRRFGRLVVLRYLYGSEWLCKCDCGSARKGIDGRRLRIGQTKSCGCLHAERARTLHKSRRPGKWTAFGGSSSPEYRAYIDAKHRCTNPNSPSWPDYGGRGIEFRFKNFGQLFREVGPRPENTSLDRIKNYGHYERGNVKWSTPVEQANNRRVRLQVFHDEFGEPIY